MTQGTHRNSRTPLVEDLDAMITSRSLKPGKIKFGGRFWTIKRDYNAEGILEFHRLTATEAGSREAFKTLVGEKDAHEFAELVLSAPTEIMGPVLRRIYQHAGLLKRIDTTEAASEEDPDADAEGTGEGESLAS
jgi:hypothetical protein